jgi:hypothetical protein
VSLLLRDEVRILFNPDRVAMERLGRGFHPAVVARNETACAAPVNGEAPWVKALDGLETCLAGLGTDKIDAVVVLSNHFVRYALLPWSDQISDTNEEQAFIRHCFVQTYGEEARHWAFRLSPGGYGEAQVASAIDQGLLDGLERVMSAHGLRLVSLQPGFMTAFNQWRQRLLDPVAWFVVAEPGRLCLSLLQQGRWCSLKTVKVGNEWQQALKKLLEREFLVSESGTERGTVYLHAPDLNGETELPGWTVRHLGATPGVAPMTGTPFVITL